MYDELDVEAEIMNEGIWTYGAGTFRRTNLYLTLNGIDQFIM
jgi:hypothetical protein